MNDCNEGARKMERMEEICVLQTQIEFRTKVSKHFRVTRPKTMTFLRWFAVADCCTKITATLYRTRRHKLLNLSIIFLVEIE